MSTQSTICPEKTITLSTSEFWKGAALRYVHFFTLAFLVAATSVLADGMPEAKRHTLSYEWVMENGTPLEQEDLAIRHFNGKGAQKDYAKARELAYKAALECQSNAMVVLTLVYQKGLGVKKDPIAALGWSYATITSEFGERILKTRKELEDVLTSEEIAKAKDLAENWMAEHCR